MKAMENLEDAAIAAVKNPEPATATMKKLEPVAAAMRLKYQGVKKPNGLTEHLLYFYRQQLFRIYLATEWDGYLETRHRSTKPWSGGSNRVNRRASFLQTTWVRACRGITLNMTPEEAREFVDVRRRGLTQEQRGLSTDKVFPPVPPPERIKQLERPAYQLRLAGKTVAELRLRYYRMLVSTNYRRFRQFPQYAMRLWMRALAVVPDDLPIEQAQAKIQSMWDGMNRKERSRQLQYLEVPTWKN
jgi:hypothetical protein